MTAAQPLDVFGCRLDETALIEASAGTGKTWAICGLVLRLLLERGIEISRILVVTFTKAATAELRERIRSRIAQTLAVLEGQGPDADDPFVDRLLQRLRTDHGLADTAMARRLDLALRCFDEAAIFTIHGFCARTLADTPFATGLPMAQDLIEDDSELRRRVVQDFWRREVAGAALAPAFAAHLVACGDSPERWDALVQRAVAKPLARLCWPDGIDRPLPPAGAALEDAHRAAQATWRADRERIVAIVEAAVQEQRLSRTVYRDAAVASSAAEWDRLFAGDVSSALAEPFDKLDLLTPAKLKPNKGKAPPAPHPFFAQAATLLDERAAARSSLEVQRLQMLRRLLGDTPVRLRALLRAQRVVAYDGMLYALYERLNAAGGVALAAALRRRFAAALIDEFQDTDPLQYTIFRALAGGHAPAATPMFFVGDPKQAIYGFRNADLHAYLRARRDVGRCHSLADNQRASRALLDGLNALFGANPRAFVLDGLEYVALRLGDKPRPQWEDSTAARAPLQLWSLPAGDDGQPPDKPEATTAAVNACAGEITRLLGAGRRGEIRNGGRNLAGGDIAVLVRSHRQGRRVREALERQGVGCVELSRASVFATPDAEAIAQVLRALLEPTHERLLRAALATDLLGADAVAIDGLGADEAALAAVMTRFAAYRERWRSDGIGPMWRALVSGEGIAARLLERADGERRMTNLLHLAECLQQAEAEHPAPEPLLRWFEAQRDGRSGDETTQLRLESDRHLVQIVTIHRAKGLEYPIVFCPLLWDGASPKGDRIDGREYHDENGDVVIDFRQPLDAAISARIASERMAEDLRLVYVALTRAVQRCVVTVGPYRSRRSDKESGRSALNWLVAGGASTAEQWLENGCSAELIRSAWATFAQRHADAVRLDPLPAGPWTPLEAEHADPESIAALPPPPAIAPAWRIGSFSSLVHSARHEAAALDHDARVATTPIAEQADEPAAIDGDDILHFPRGPAAGTCLHAVFERIDFTDASGWPAAIDECLRLRPPGQGSVAEATRHARMLARMLADVLHVPLADGLELATVPPRRRLIELEFHLEVPHLDAGALGALLCRHGVDVPGWTFGSLQGWLKGYIDLVVEHQGRCYLIDWKSNHLGMRPGDYAGAALAQAMRMHGYRLQYLLYTVALHRLLTLRRDGYDYERDFGGVAYLFVRGLRKGWRGEDGTNAGVFFDRPPRLLIEELSALLADRRSG